eukprot:CAMPEP_0171759710 /NCGR_PEP_ID=MMETSP0991-20121206/47048_1 /TAXON_ID=483369 /ORGANISM="non described non described, Strain CCMP2098" /LENGTH=57 /DNA_ID=CAMNT_0012362685 /DNA_START=221 /DNA_END=395 /DNA_ORIENTATION=+
MADVLCHGEAEVSAKDPSAASMGLVAPSKVLPALTAFRPWKAIMSTGPEVMYSDTSG